MISIVIPLYKVEPYIERCLISLEAQYEQDLEVIVVNDGTPDASAEIVREYQKSSKLNIKLIDRENRGVSVARNVGIEQIGGEFVCFVDSDDMLDRNYLSIMKSAIIEHGADICICGARYIDEADGTLYDNGGECKVSEFNKTQALEKLLYKELSAGIWALMCRRETLGDLRFAENFHYSEDLEMVWKLAASSDTIVCVDAPLYCYRVRGGSAMSVVNEKRLDGMRLFESLADFIRDNAPEFYPQYASYGVASWVWSTLWQEAIAAESYGDFKMRAELYSPREHLKKLYTYKRKSVAISSFLYVNFRAVYYYAVKMYKKNYRNVTYK